MLDRNLEFTKTLSTKGQEFGVGPQANEPMRRTDGALPRAPFVSQSVEGGIGRRNPRNDYEYIKMKNSSWGNKFDIISNKIKDFAKQATPNLGSEEQRCSTSTKI
eukprot:GABU01008725.1.p1 GENE.GABU01008725.1~~GABU01008725.1.p1  ORF type:complete len:122 (+),score=32.56 GABU01008725.1:54-368(+)